VAGEELKPRIKSLCSDVSPQVIDEFFSRLDDDYFATFSPEEIATHIRMSGGLNARQRVHVRFVPRDSGSEFDIILVGFDYVSEFSVFCGLLSAFGLDIHAGNIYSFARGSTSRRSPGKIVDVFSVGLRPGEVFDETKQREFEQELQTLAGLLATSNADQARERLNRFLTERIENMNEPLTGLVHPMEIGFDNELSPEWTVMEARSEDAFAFLYAVSNALAMQGIYIHKVKIRSIGHEARDRFFISDRLGRKILDAARQERLRTAVVMIKQFTRFLPGAADPAKAMRHFDQFLDKMAEENFPDHVMSFLARAEGMDVLARLLGSSDYLWEEFLRVHFRGLLPLLEQFAESGAGSEAPARHELQAELRSRLQAAASFEEKRAAANRFKDDRLFLINVQHLLSGRSTLIEFSTALTTLAEVLVHEAIPVCVEHIGGPMPGLFTVCGLGKFGGREMGYASDLELLFIHEEQGSGRTAFFEALARQVIEFIEARTKGIFQVDLRLRPYGDAGAWSTPLEEFRRYYSAAGAAAPFERQALIKLRWAAGNQELGRRVEAHRDSFTYSSVPWNQENALHLRQRQMRELVKPGELNVKYSAGGLIDIEYAVQYLQLLHGSRHAELRAPNTLEALDAVRSLGIISNSEYEVLKPAYLFLRNLIDALRMVRGDASDLLLPEQTSEFKSLARRLGYSEHDRAKAAQRLSADIQRSMTEVHDLFIARFGRPS